ncbi:DUF1223 domain-containing protein [Breoghania sp.]|uniref:DUF1223 domain-containing protein n=1 Tax=Breoghania sp. TaxID=2065378 RepID=UPI002AA7608B|nr:DUF1223 domain-containing protein [Breoghania sp.]
MLGTDNPLNPREPARHKSVAALCSTLALALSLLLPAPAAADPKAVVELFTSQGCASCPPADKLLGELAKQEDLIVLSLPVNYWDYLGWKDTLASTDNSARQRAYADLRGDRAVYTPQAVVNGRRHAIGSDKRALQNAIKGAGGLPVSVSAEMGADALDIHVGRGKTPGMMATVWLVLFDYKRKVPIARGENGGRTITYHNVVRRMQAIGIWKGEPASYSMPRGELVKAGMQGCAILIQGEDGKGHPGPIVGATYLARDQRQAAAR